MRQEEPRRLTVPDHAAGLLIPHLSGDEYGIEAVWRG